MCHLKEVHIYLGKHMRNGAENNTEVVVTLSLITLSLEKYTLSVQLYYSEQVEPGPVWIKKIL